MESEVLGATRISRADFIKGLGVAGTMLGGALIGGCSSGTQAGADANEIVWDDEADVVVCGCGTGGAPAAIDAHDAGADVLIIEKMDWIGGCMRRCGGGVLAAETIVQEKLGVDDTADMLYEYLVACAEGYCDPELLRVFADNSGPNFNWIIEDLGGQPLEEWDFPNPADKGYGIIIKPGLNVSGTPVHYEKYGMADKARPRCHWFKPNPADVDPGDRIYSDFAPVNMGEGRGGTGLWKPFEENLKKRKIRIQTETSLAGLVTNADGEVIGVKVTVGDAEKRIKAKRGVVIATGSFVNDPVLYENFTGEKWKEATEMAMKTGAPLLEQCDGAGTKAALGVGAAPSFIFQGMYGGIKINTDAQVVATDGNVIPRLYAGSYVVGGLLKRGIYPACGIAVSTSICFGRIAGQNAAKLEPWA